MLTSDLPSSSLYFKGSRCSPVDRKEEIQRRRDSLSPSNNATQYQTSVDRVSVREQDPNQERSSSAGARQTSSTDESTLLSQSLQRRRSFSTLPNSSSIKRKESS